MKEIVTEKDQHRKGDKTEKQKERKAPKGGKKNDVQDESPSVKKGHGGTEKPVAKNHSKTLATGQVPRVQGSE